MRKLFEVDNFGDVAAEEDAVLSYFLKTPSVDAIESGKVMLVLGRKGAGKTALVRYFSQDTNPTAVALNLRDYPWEIHKTRASAGTSEVESYVSSWRYLIAVQSLIRLLQSSRYKANTDSKIAANKFLSDNYGSIEPSLGDILRPKSLQLSKASFQPSVLGNALGGVELERAGGIGVELDKLTDLLLECAIEIAVQDGARQISLHFDELDQGMAELTTDRAAILTGLVLAGRSIRNATKVGFSVFPVVYLRSDIWDQLSFSDKNKISQSSTLWIEWNPETLAALVGERLTVKMGADARWTAIDDGKVMRGSQPKWSHIVSRTFMRPRDIIKFLNAALTAAKARDATVEQFSNKDIQNARQDYSTYLKTELDDEIKAHWPQWGEALQVFSAISRMTFSRQQFEDAYESRRTKSNKLDAGAALETLYKYSVVGYRKGQGYGGSGWVFQYLEPQAGWDGGASLLKVHDGLKEYARLREERAGI